MNLNNPSVRDAIDSGDAQRIYINEAIQRDVTTHLIREEHQSSPRTLACFALLQAVSLAGRNYDRTEPEEILGHADSFYAWLMSKPEPEEAQ